MSTKECCGNPLRGCMDCPPRKLTFEEWFIFSGWRAKFAATESLDDADSFKFFMREAWNAAQENK